MDKKIKKLSEGECHFCKEEDYCVLDVHRIHEGKDGGKYKEWNTVVACACCHRKIHDGQIKIDRWCFGTNGRVLHYFIGEAEYYN